MEEIVNGIEPGNKLWDLSVLQVAMHREALERFSEHTMERSVDVTVPAHQEDVSVPWHWQETEGCTCRREAGRNTELGGWKLVG